MTIWNYCTFCNNCIFCGDNLVFDEKLRINLMISQFRFTYHAFVENMLCQLTDEIKVGKNFSLRRSTRMMKNRLQFAYAICISRIIGDQIHILLWKCAFSNYMLNISCNRILLSIYAQAFIACHTLFGISNRRKWLPWLLLLDVGGRPQIWLPTLLRFELYRMLVYRGFNHALLKKLGELGMQ
jgi:hypothetical protein